MAAIKIDRFGGVMPSVDPRNLADSSAQTAHNLDLRFGDFRPVRGIGESVATVTAGAKTIFRTPSGVWLSSARDANYVNNQVSDVGYERVYVTGNNTEYPEAWQESTYYRLGVPAPLTAPSTTVVVADEYTRADQDASANEIVDAVTAAVRINVSAAYFGNTKPSNGGTFGGLWLNHGDASELATADASDIAYVVPATGLVPTAASDAYLGDPSLNGAAITYLSTGYLSIAMSWRATGYSVNTTTLKAALLALTLPPDNTAALLTDAQAQAIVDRIADLASPSKSPVLQYVSNINQRQIDVRTQILRADDDIGRALALSSAIQKLDTEVKTLDAYFQGLSANLRAYVATILSGYRYVLTTAVDRVLETRVYLHTYVNEWGQESAPSPASELLELDQNDSVAVTIGACPVDDPYVPITKWRLYRSSTTNLGAAYQLVVEQDISDLSYEDEKKQEELEEECQTLTWTEPREELLGLVGGPNGIMAGFFGKTLAFCEPYAPYAWPREYELTLEYNIVAIGVYDQTFVVLTEGFPYYVSGADSASMSALKKETPQSCVSKRSVCSADGGVFFVSPDGVCLAGPTGVALLTQGAYDRKDWQDLDPANSFAAFSEGVYYLFTDTA